MEPSTMEPQAEQASGSSQPGPSGEQAKEEPPAAGAAGAEPAGAAGAPKPRKFILERGCEPALQLLAVLGMDRAAALDSLAERAVEELLDKVPSMPIRRRQMLLAASFPHITSPRLRPVAIAALEHADEIPPEILEALTGPQKEVLGTLPLAVRQRVWETEHPPSLFLAETYSLVIQLTDQIRSCAA